MAPNIDHYNRKITYLRVSVTDRCNLRCMYCRPGRTFKLLEHSEILRYEEMIKIVHAAVAHIGIRKVRLTGGEPLLRRDFVYLVSSLCRIPGIREVCVTTNGSLLKKYAEAIFKAGARRVNISLDTLNPLKYHRITGRPRFKEVWEGIETAAAVGFTPIRLNVVVMRGINDDELLRFAELSVHKPYHIRFIEYMPIGPHPSWRPEKFISSDEIKSRLRSFGDLSEIPHAADDGPAERYRFQTALGEIGFISPLSHHFCNSCNRLRLLANGKLRPCLFSDDEVDLMPAVRAGCSPEALKPLFLKAIEKKPEQHHPAPDMEHHLRPMSAIGG